MKFFLDTANLEQIKEVASWGILDGVTTNPSLISKEGKLNLEKHLKAICALVEGPVSMEVIALDTEGMLAQGREYASWAENIVVKIPMTENGLKAVKILREEGVETNVTLVFSANQALLAAKAGATFVSPFIGRLEDDGHDGMTLVQEITTIFENYHFATEVLTASIRSPRQITEAALLGSDVVTMPKAVFDKLVKHPRTDAGLEKFLADWNKHHSKK
jgi:transaldolase